MKRIDRSALLGLGLGVAAAACTVSETQPTVTKPPPAKVAHSGTTVSSSIAITSDDSALWVVNQDEDSVSVIDAETRAVTGTIPVPAAPVSVAAAPDGSAVYVVSHEAAQVTQIDPKTDAVVKSLGVTEHPWGVSVSADGASLFVTHLLLDPGVSTIDAKSLTLRGKVMLAEQMPGDDKRLANGVPRGLYSAVPDPLTGELWVPHLLLSVKTQQPDLDFESTVFPTISTIAADGSAEGRRLLFRPSALPDAEGSFSDVVSGPRVTAFTPDGKLALVLNTQSEDVLVFDVKSGYEVGLVRPVPSALAEGMVMDHAGKHAYVEGRNTHDVTVLAIDETDPVAPVIVDGAPIERISADPMPAEMRLGQRLFFTANSAKFPVTQNFWVACSSCHIEAGSDGVTWLFSVGPRDTPSNAGGPINTGFLLRQGLYARVEQYDQVNQVEQGGSFDLMHPGDQASLGAIATFVNYAVPFPQNPNLAPDGKLTESQARGKQTFEQRCTVCHPGAYLTDSAAGNPEHDLTKPILLHDIGTCVTTGAVPDRPARDRAGNMHTACDFDTPTLRGIFATPPYFHDGSARTLRDVVDRLMFSADLSDADKEDLVAYLKTL